MHAPPLDLITPPLLLPQPTPVSTTITTSRGEGLLRSAAYFGRSALVTDLPAANSSSSSSASPEHYLCRFHQLLNQRLCLGLKTKKADGHSSRFKFTYRPKDDAVFVAETIVTESRACLARNTARLVAGSDLC